MGKNDIRGDAESLVVHQPKQILAGRIALLGGQQIPVDRDIIGLWDAATVGIHEAEGRLGAGVTALGQRYDSSRRGGVAVANGGALNRQRSGIGERTGANPNHDSGSDETHDLGHDFSLRRFPLRASRTRRLRDRRALWSQESRPSRSQGPRTGRTAAGWSA